MVASCVGVFVTTAEEGTLVSVSILVSGVAVVTPELQPVQTIARITAINNAIILFFSFLLSFIDV